MPHPNDTALTLAGAAGNLDISYWDLWFLLVAQDGFDGKLPKLATSFKTSTRKSLCNREWLREKLWHAKDLGQRLETAGIDAGMAAEAIAGFDKKELRKAKEKVLTGSEPMRKNKSHAMIETPERKGQRFALSGYWEEFPVSPQKTADCVLPEVECDDFDLDDSFEFAEALDVGREKAEKLAAAGRTDDAVAALRGLMTEALRTIARADDSCGSIGESFHLIFAAYRKVLDAAGFFWQEPYLPDLLEFMIWEDYGLTDGQTYGWFRNPPEEMAAFCIEYLTRRRRELLADDLAYRAEDALKLLVQVAAEQRRFDLFPKLIRAVAGQHWEPVLMLAKAAAARKPDLARTVFEDSMASPRHRDFLMKHYQAFQQGTWNWKPGQR